MVTIEVRLLRSVNVSTIVAAQGVVCPHSVVPVVVEQGESLLLELPHLLPSVMLLRPQRASDVHRGGEVPLLGEVLHRQQSIP